MSRWVNTFLAGIVLDAAMAIGAQTAAVEIGGRWELLVDDYLIDAMSGQVELRLHRPVPREVVLIHDRPWEGNTCGYHTIFKDGDLYRMYHAWGLWARQ